MAGQRGRSSNDLAGGAGIFMSHEMDFLTDLHTVSFLGHSVLLVVLHTTSCIECPFTILNLHLGVCLLVL